VDGLADIERFMCPACGYPDLDESPWNILPDGWSASFKTCPCCFLEFGVDDWADADPDARSQFWFEWRRKWMDEGMPWRGEGAYSTALSKEPGLGRPPDGWDPLRQLADAGLLNE
jgi:hypothetical protein